MNGKCITARLEVMPQVLALAKEYKRIHHTATDAEAMWAGRKAFHQEMQRQTVSMKKEMGLPW